MASAVVEMLTLSHCRKVFNTDFSVDSDTDVEQVSGVNGVDGKRMLSEVEDDQDRSHVKKRRKQSKPVRIASSESHSDVENYTENGLPEKKSELATQDSSALCENSVIDTGNIVTWNSNDERYKVKDNKISENYEPICNQEENDNSLVPINLSNAKCSPSNVLSDYVATQVKDANHNLNLEKSRQNTDTRSCSFQEPSFEGGSHFERDILFTASSSSPLSFPTVKPVQTPTNGQHQSPVGGSPVRIFNPEAFCDLCNKEFCNKYFLKTHKANKHGIYSESIGTNLIEALPALPFINYFTNVNEALPSSSQIARTVLRKPQVVPSSLPQQNPIYLQKPVSSNGNTRAFCNICQREFCNKYFVRRHKAKIHGIIDTSFPDTPPSDVQEQKMLGSDIKLCVGNHEKCEDDEIYSSFCDQQANMIGHSVVSTKETDKHEQRLGEIKTLTLPGDQQNVKHLKETDSDSCTSSGVSRNASPLQVTTPTSAIHQPDEMDASDKIKRSVFANSEAFCDICNKEYCNKYFLRTHKMRSHGITHADWDKRDDRQNGFENSMSYLGSQNMPLNLIMTDQTVGKIEKDGTDVQPYGIFCNVCGQKFKDMFLLKMHVSYAHPQELYEKQVTNENSDGFSNEKLLKSSKPAIKMETSQDASTRMINSDCDEKNFHIDFQTSSLLQCEICHKSVDASSFDLHIESEHGSLMDEVGISTLTEDNSDSQMFQKEIKYECAMCQKQLTSTSLLNQHIIEYHGTGTTGQQLSVNNIVNMKTAKEPDEPPKSGSTVTEVQTTPTSSFCEICKKELCNKYFMKTHMQRMHGISIDNGAHIGGVVCDICNKELCSKYFLRVHKQNSHGIVDEILGLDMSRNHSPGTDASLRPAEQSDLNNRYFSHFTEVCTICSRRFRSMKWLKAHLLNDHGDEGKDKWKDFQAHFELKQLDRYQQELQKKPDSMSMSIVTSQANTNGNVVSTRNNDSYSLKIDASSQPNDHEDNLKSNVFTTIFNNKSTNRKQYHCSYCPFSTSILAFLFVHERSHINGSSSLLEHTKKLQCKICLLTFECEETYEKHCLSHTLSEETGSISNGYNTSENEKSSKPIGFESSIKEDSGELHKQSPYSFKVNVRCMKEIKVDEPQREVNELDLIESYNNVLLDVSEERPRQNAQVDDQVNVALTQVKQSLELIANKTDIPVSLSVPHSQKHLIMQPFVLEDVSSAQLMSMDVKKAGFKKFLSSIVFLPVTERFTNPVTVSFKLTPTT